MKQNNFSKLACNVPANVHRMRDAIQVRSAVSTGGK
eukprot:CAMPEP_0174331784 /NCGR_PEP_ID=MMETSP0810-20121108/17770_1 /TAXON_ID=73025 ORGANISM="Eutreptiella gymnastica-like, Strain CCMP1594" /NCGR_SAMPLE_ID=MMETSP0810 /ASSEMBLY_ACC=CAM_ASM_000659 /LENGTH=35 /DNA_ID= /DNA_START= /DNA_END= /DNA_ORIENTATION=